ncbi:25S rRNA (adenine645-N1)-methyltransferase [Sporobolomyces koalae]|uniref:25S rRNA (adenine645-N1)-methyltransferase n=1 Tax=Sporobolomyces koalae TaxID=500713 RepID=UPI00316DF24D
MLFDTPLLNVQAAPVAEASTASAAKKRKRSGSTAEKDQLAQTGQVNLEKLMKTMKKIEGASSGSNRTPIGTRSSDGADGKGKAKATKGKGKANKPAAADKEHQSPAKGKETQRTRDEQGQGKSKKQKQKQSDAAPAKPAHSSSLLRPSSPGPASEPAQPFRHSAPNTASTSQAAAPPQSAMQAQLRAKLAGGKFRMLNETLYTTSGQDAWNLMKEEGAFDDYHSGFRSQASNWPVNPLSVISNSLLSSLPANSLVADFGCGDAGLARTLSPAASSSGSTSGAALKLKLAQPKLVTQKALKVVSFDLVSQNPYVIEAECSSVPLPGSPTSSEGQVVDAVVCCLSLMGTDWINMIREARRVLRTDGKLLIAEVTSRFDKIDEFVKLVESVGFESTGKDDSNTHFVLVDFVKTASSAEQVNEAKKQDNTRKGSTLLKPCIYKKR